MTESSAMRGQTYTLNRFKFEYHDTRTNGSRLHFWRIQFPVMLAFTMTINRSQGSTMDRIGISLRTEVFAPGQLYVAFSRVRTAFSIGIWAPNAPRVNGRIRLKNIVARGLRF
uniref:ATP-dependent DNA helicase n=1 Tax=Ditylenchus dipsaci TaxID=166011 RepID=A0A915D101_9BILA